ncbi:nitroreductase family protein [Porticoccaceae bacterium LTM1]|nr:nitroreductase family protein [Porticoccaceae bacterium LTM1]
MKALEVLHNRVSVPSLEAPAPEGEVLLNIQRAALRAADHRLLQPWRFLVIEGEGLDRLGELFVQSKTNPNEPMSEAERASWAAKPHRAPMIIVAIASIHDDPKVPEVEQLISTGCAVQNMLNAAHAQGIGAMWRTGDFAYNEVVKTGLGLAENEQIVGFLYLGTPKGRLKPVPAVSPDQFFTAW